MFIIEKIKNLRPFFEVSSTEYVVAIILILPVLLRISMDVLISRFQVSDYLQTTQDFLLEEVWYRLNNPFMANVVNFVVWLVIGAVAISIIIFLITSLTDFKDDLTASLLLVHPKSFKQSDFWLAAIGQRIIRFTAVAMLIFYAGTLLKGTPTVYESLRFVFMDNNNDLWIKVSIMLFACLSWLLGWHLIVVFFRVSKALSDQLD